MLHLYYDSIIYIGEKMWIGKKGYMYDFGYNETVALSGCMNYSYIANKVLAFKKDSKILVYSTKMLNKNGFKYPEKLLEFTAYSNVAYGKIICEYNTYLIDGNCQIKYSTRPHIS